MIAKSSSCGKYINNLAVLLIVLFLTCTTNQPVHCEDSKGHYIYQTSGILGDQDVFVSQNGIKIINKSTNLVTVARAPRWNVTTYHEKTKTLCTEPLARFNGYISEKEFVSTGKFWSKLPLKKSNTNTIAGISSLIYITPQEFTKNQIKDWSRQFADSKFIKSARYCVSENLNIPAKAKSVLCKFYGLKNLGGVPLEFKYHDLGGYLHVGLTTSSQEKIDSKKIDLSIPSNFKKVKNHKTLLSISQDNKTKVRKRRPLL